MSTHIIGSTLFYQIQLSLFIQFDHLRIMQNLEEQQRLEEELWLQHDEQFNGGGLIISNKDEINSKKEANPEQKPTETNGHN